MHPAAEKIAGTFDGWLNAEVRSSGVGVNEYLDEYTTAVRGLRGGYNHPDNFTARKNESHLGIRMPQAWATYQLTQGEDVDPKIRDNQSGFLMFTPLMQVSGTFRTQCYLEASSPEDYLVRRHNRPHGIDMEHIVSERLAKWLPESDSFTEAGIDIPQLGRQIEIVAALGRKSIEAMCEQTGQNLDLEEEETISTRHMQVAQREWAGLATDCLILAAKIRRGELEAVPFWEPKSISSTPPPEVIYPLDSNFSGFRALYELPDDIS